MSLRIRHWKRWLLAGAAVVVVLVVGIPFVYIHFIEGSAPARLHLPSTKTTTPSGAATTAVGSWKVAPGSQAGYRIGEVLFGQTNTAVGRTAAATGTMTIGPSGVTATTITVDLTQVSSDRSQRDHQFQGRIMDTAAYPTATFTLASPIALDPLPAPGATVAVTAAGRLALHGTTKPAQAQLQARQVGATVQVSGSIPVTFATWNIPNPSFGPVTTDDHGLIEFLLTFTRA